MTGTMPLLIGDAVKVMLVPEPTTLVLLSLAPIAALVWLALRESWTFAGSRSQQARDFLPASVPSPSRVARIVEAAVLGVAGLLVLAVAATTRSTGGYMLNLDELPPEYATVNVIMFVCALIGVGIAILVTILGRTAAGTILMSVVLIGYGTVLNGPRHPGEWFVSQPTTEPAVEYTFDVDGTNARGVELWVNGVRLGKMPYTTTLGEFEAKVPYWSKPPADLETATTVAIPYYDLQSPGWAVWKQWFSLELPLSPSFLPRPFWASLSSKSDTHRDPKSKTYYARVRYADQWGGGRGGCYSAGSNNGLRAFRINVSLSVVIPDRKKRLDKLLNMARLANYRVGPEWFEAVESHHEDGWVALNKAAERDPRMMEVLNARAAWRYGLDKATDADSAWQAFQRVCFDADARREYFTASAAGRAVELLVPKLSQERLVDTVVALLRDYNMNDVNYLHWTWTSHSRVQFGCTYRRGGVDLGSTKQSGRSGGGNYTSKQFPPSGFAVAHAVWMLKERLRADAQPGPNILQRRIAPEIIRSQYKEFGSYLPMTFAADIGGPGVDKFFLRQNWRAKADQLDWSQRTHFGTYEANKWLCLLALLNDDAGRCFRLYNTSVVMDLADGVLGKDIYSDWPNGIEFIFVDPWLAKEYWPRYARRVRQEKVDTPLCKQWQYLVYAGDAATVDTFIEAWLNTNPDINDFINALGILDQLKPPMRQNVVDALARQVEEHPDNLQKCRKSFGSQERLLDTLYEHAGAQQLANRLLAKLQKGAPAIPGQGFREQVLRNVQPWLAHTQPDSPLVAMLAKADKPQLRLMIMDTLRECPTPEHQSLLKKLLKDPDSAVRAAAEKVSQQLKTLAAQQPAEYASNPASVASTPSAGPTSRK